MSPHAAPFIRLLLPFASGIAIGNAVSNPLPGLLWILILGSVAAFFWSEKPFHFDKRHYFGLFAAILLFLLGYYQVTRYDERLDRRHFSHQPGVLHYCIGVVDEPPSKGTRTRIALRVEGTGITADSLKPGSGRLLLLLEPSPKSDSIRYGDRLGIQAVIRPVQPPLNPKAFDYRQYLARQNIHHSAFVDADSVMMLSSGHGSRVWRMAYTSRDWLLALLKQHFPTPDEYSVAAALLVGYKDELSDELRTAYTETGSIHALVVSGSHVSALFFGLMLLLGRLPIYGHRARWVELLLALPLIWAFTFLTGATASVMRAAIMFSIYLFGKALWRDANVWNVMASSAFGLLIFQPYLLFDAGFQLSYAAVAGMVFFYPRFYQLSPIFPYWADWLWKPFLLGCAAQLGTLPLSLYYFHQFPVYFWLSGWVVMLGGGLFLAGGALLVIFHPISSVITNLIGHILYYAAKLLNWLIFQIQALPGNVIENIWISPAGIIFLFLLVLAFATALETRQGRWVAVMVAALAVLSAERMGRFMHAQEHPKIVIYHAGKARIIDFFDGGGCTTLSDTLPEKRTFFTAGNNRLASGATSGKKYYFSDTLRLQNQNLLADFPFIGFYTQKIVCLDGKTHPSEQQNYPKDIQVVIFSHNPKISPDWCHQQFPAALWVLDATNSTRWIEKWTTACQQMHPNYHNVTEQGAWVWEQ